ncbi:hypothetical protein U472_10140 [Orenia metallireducens]|uniref:Methyl-accepting chemotaxis sensory transducer with Cache sensor n=1 Tax=Orenia metallireducens TaxID=1413210 RepID=A0A1C0A815_9FIRM|nr:cache domain-containing protein [Orenia metallireducens]OCL26358.1 hypothetical protein U472_10140 [Orenia metallireducens]
MKIFRNMQNIKFKLLCSILTIVLLVIVGISVTSYSFMKDRLYEEKRYKLKNLVESNLGTLNYYHKLEKQGFLSQKEAQARAKDLIKNTTYGREGQDYFWINDLQSRMIMHPTSPKLNGQDVSNIKDSNGVQIFVEMVDIVKEEGNGFLEYRWQYYDEKGRIEPKLSYVAGFEPWGWVLGTGIYIDDIKANLASLIRVISLVATITFILVTVIVYYLANYFARPIIELTSKVNKFAQGDLTVEIIVDREDEIGQLGENLEMMRNNLNKLIADIFEIIENLSAYSEELSASAQEGNATIESTNSLVENMSANIQQIAASSQEVTSFSQNATSQTEQGFINIQETIDSNKEINRVVDKTLAMIRNLEANSKEIGKVVEFITNIAEQTNLLALNAAIESARAGEYGRGFAVVADEIRELAKETNSATDNISSLIKEIQNLSTGGLTAINHVKDKVKEGEVIAEKAGQSFENIKKYSIETSTQIEQTTLSAQSLAGSSEQLMGSSQDIVNMSSEVANSAQELTKMAQNLQELIHSFKI